MVCSCQSQQGSGEREKQLLEDLIAANKGTKGNLVAVLQGVQEIYGYLPHSALCLIQEELGIKAAKIYGVATFYTQFRLNPIGKHLIMLCQGTACHVNGAERIETAICQELKIEPGETTADGLFTLDMVACLGCCSLAPVMMVDDQVYGPLTPEGAVKVIRELYQQESESGGGAE